MGEGGRRGAGDRPSLYYEREDGLGLMSTIEGYSTIHGNDNMNEGYSTIEGHDVMQSIPILRRYDSILFRGLLRLLENLVIKLAFSDDSEILIPPRLKCQLYNVIVVRFGTDFVNSARKPPPETAEYSNVRREFDSTSLFCVSNSSSTHSLPLSLTF